MVTDTFELTITDDNTDDGIIIIRHDLGDVQIDQAKGYMKGRCVGREGFKEQMVILQGLQERGLRT